MNVESARVRLAPRPRGFHLITRELLDGFPLLATFERGLLHVFIRHTSAGLTLNENADPDVRTDFETIFDALVPDGRPEYVHTIEGPDDMSAHVKSSVVGSSLLIPIARGRLDLGTWQGIYLCEFRDSGGSRDITVTAIGIQT